MVTPASHMASLHGRVKLVIGRPGEGFAGLRRWSSLPGIQRRELPFASLCPMWTPPSAERGEKRAHVLYQQVRCFHRGEMAAPVILRPSGDRVLALDEAAYGYIGREHRDGSGNRRLLHRPPPRGEVFGVDSRGRA